jgi:hypothetical protein
MRLLLTLLFESLIASDPPARRVVGIVQPSGRVVEDFSDQFKLKLHPDVAERLAAQSAQDTLNDQFTPHSVSILIEKTPFGVMTLGQTIHRGMHSTVYAIKEFPNLLIKYQAHCRDLDTEVHPLLLDAWHTNASSAIGVSPIIHFISPPARLCHALVGKCAFTMSRDDLVDCRDDDGVLRYMIMEKLEGKSLHNFRMKAFASTNGAMDFNTAISIGIELIRLIQRLHEEIHIVHGDIHSPNVMIKKSNETEFELKLIDFGLSFNISNVSLPENIVKPRGFWYHELYTIWQIEGFDWGPRDDVMRAIQTIAHLMHPYGYFDMERRLAEQGYRNLKSWKLTSNWFITSSLDPVMALKIGGARKGWIYALLDHILRIGRNMQINQRPPYEEIIAAFTECLEISKPMVITTTSEPTTSPLISVTNLSNI